MKEIRINAYAKINLSLDVLGKLENGYHQVKMVMQAIELHDTVNLAWEAADPDSRKEKKLEVELDPGTEDLPTDRGNLAFAAAERLREKYCPDISGRLFIQIEKNIPQSAGLAGGSSDAAAVILGLAGLWDIDADLEELCRFGGEIGADVVFSMMSIAACEEQLGLQENKMASACALAEGTGTEMTPLPALKSGVVLSKPDFPLSTKEVYEGIDGCSIEKHPDVDAQAAALRNGDIAAVIKNMGNVLELYSLKKYDRIMYTKNMMREITDHGPVLMSGSGPTVFALTHSRKEIELLHERMSVINRETIVTRTVGGE